MMRALSLLARVVPIAAAFVLAGCDGGGTEPDPRLTAQQVSGVYKFCSLSFRPIQSALPEADVLFSIIEDNPPAPKTPPSLTLSGTANSFQLIYTRASDLFTQQFQGSVTYGSESINLAFPDESEIRRELLLPPQLLLHFSTGPRALAAVGEQNFAVRRADYARAARISEEGLQDRINGTLLASFSTGNCPS